MVNLRFMKNLNLIWFVFLIVGILPITTLGQYIKAGIIMGNDLYTDIKPDSIFYCQAIKYSQLHGGSMDIDIDNDGASDFRIQMFAGGSSMAEWGFGFISPLRSSCKILCHPDTTYSLPSNTPVIVNAPDTLELGDSINSSLKFCNTDCYLWDYSSSFSSGSSDMNLWTNIGDHYIGTSIETVTDTLYGWIRVNAQMRYYRLYTLIIKDFGCNRNPNVGISQKISSGIKIFPNPVKDKLRIIVPETCKNRNVSILSSVGQIVLHKALMNRPETIDMSRMPQGIYLLRIESENNVMYKKVVKE